jgi:hypothetical protein
MFNTRIIENLKKILLTGLLTALLPLTAAAESELTGKAVAESRFFLQDAPFTNQTDKQFSLSMEAEWYTDWNDGMDSLTFKPFLRYDSEDSERTHGDIRELLWLHVGEDWELRTGIGKVYWGVTESQHLVDVINQTDNVEAIDGEQKLGQPMVHLSLIKEWGTIDAFILPWFRESNFASLDGRFRPELEVKDDQALFESGAQEKHVDFALRWSHTIEDWDVGLSYFKGTDRNAGFVPSFDYAVYLKPYYAQMDQFGVDIQATIESWLWKVEVIHRKTEADSFTAMTGGFEYTIGGVFDTVWDLGMLAEYQYDQRDDIVIAAGQNDLFFGSRIAFNDEDSTELLFGLVQDLDRSSSRSGLLEASSRINDNWKWRVDAWFFQSDTINEVTYAVRRDDFLQFSLEYYF